MKRHIVILYNRFKLLNLIKNNCKFFVNSFCLIKMFKRKYNASSFFLNKTKSEILHAHLFIFVCSKCELLLHTHPYKGASTILSIVGKCILLLKLFVSTFFKQLDKIILLTQFKPFLYIHINTTQYAIFNFSAYLVAAIILYILSGLNKCI